MEIFRGDSFYKTIKPKGYAFQTGDILKCAVMKSASSKNYIYEETITIENECESIDISINPSETAKFPTGILLFEIELTYGENVKTEQYKLEVKADGIHERN